MSDDEVDNNVCYIDEGIIGKVIKSGQKKISFHRHDQSGCKERIIESERANESHLYIICIPIIKGDDILGAIYLEKIYDNASVLKHETEQIEIIAVMIAQAVELYLLDNHTNSFLQKENERLKAVIKDKFKPSNIIGNSKPMLDIYALLNRYAATKTDILILGENGVGKELIGSILHYNGPQSNEPFIKIDCGSQLDFLMEREIFGYDKNAFEGAMHNFKGAFEQAEGGTLYFENIEELSEEIQSKFLRVLKERSFERVGGSKTLKADVRIIVASDKDLKYLVEEGTLIKELFSKLTENVIKVPALRERNNDIITLAESFINRFSSKLNKEIKRISTPVQEMLMSYSWPGNVRELETVIERAVILTEDNVIHAYDLSYFQKRKQKMKC